MLRLSRRSRRVMLSFSQKFQPFRMYVCPAWSLNYTLHRRLLYLLLKYGVNPSQRHSLAYFEHCLKLAQTFE